MAKSVLILSGWASLFGHRVQIALAEKGVEFEYTEEDLSNKSPLLLQSNPVYKKIPILIHNGKPICESRIIVEYIDEAWTDRSPLLPKDPYQRANARFWADYVDNKLYPGWVGLLRSTGEAREAAKKEFIKCLKVLEGELKDKPYFGGDTFGFLDITLVTFSGWFDVYKRDGYFNVEEECPTLIRWVKRCRERESVLKMLPDSSKIYDFMVSVRKNLEA